MGSVDSETYINFRKLVKVCTILCDISQFWTFHSDRVSAFEKKKHSNFFVHEVCVVQARKSPRKLLSKGKATAREIAYNFVLRNLSLSIFAQSSYEDDQPGRCTGRFTGKFYLLLTVGWATVTGGDGTLWRLPYTQWSSFVRSFAFEHSIGYNDNHQGSDRPNPESSAAEEVDIPFRRGFGIQGNGGYPTCFQGSIQGAYRSRASWRSGSHRPPTVFKIPSLEVVPTCFWEGLCRCHVRCAKEGGENNAWAFADC